MKCVWNQKKKESLKAYQPMPLLDTPCLINKKPKDLSELDAGENMEYMKILISALPDSALACFR